MTETGKHKEEREGMTKTGEGMTETGKHKEEREAALGVGMECNKVEGEEKKGENEKLKQIQNQGGGGGGSNLKGKSCKGYLYYSSTLKSNVTNPRCIGIPRTLRQIPNYVGQSEVEASKDGRVLTDFYYGCAGYSLYSNKDHSTDKQVAKKELPVCVGLELLVDRRVATSESASAPAHIHNKEDGCELPQPQPTRELPQLRAQKPASLVASGVARNMRRVGIYIKDSVDDILYPYRRPPKFQTLIFEDDNHGLLRRVVGYQFGSNSGGIGFGRGGSGAVSPSNLGLISQNRNISQLVNSNGRRLFLVDTLALVRRLESQGVPLKQAEAITAAITGVLNDSLENVSHSVVSKEEMQKNALIQETSLSKFKSEVQSSQEHHFSLLQHETEKLRHDIEKMRSELRHEIDKLSAGQRLDLNLERGRIREELANQNAETTNLTNKLDGVSTPAEIDIDNAEIHGLRAQLEAGKYEVIKYCLGTLVSISAVGLAAVRILM
ncbi:protein FMP32 mitochondrial [Populus alba x Populus x berolinensis]|uniref:Protein FMP32 mitochondrial n=1 Tax=Populus alba x Populus x berolinensis TaxID=444605 RepID=A0AAD6QGE7_9ROSI|nr:protein FMP32 mitochondrial [Populus alba x Populus x berolinensis]